MSAFQKMYSKNPVLLCQSVKVMVYLFWEQETASRFPSLAPPFPYSQYPAFRSGSTIYFINKTSCFFFFFYIAKDKNSSFSSVSMALEMRTKQFSEENIFNWFKNNNSKRFCVSGSFIYTYLCIFIQPVLQNPWELPNESKW